MTKPPRLLELREVNNIEGNLYQLSVFTLISQVISVSENCS